VALQQAMIRTDSRLSKVEEASKTFAETQKLLDEKVDSIHKMLMQCNPNESGSSQKSPPPLIHPSTSPLNSFTLHQNTSHFPCHPSHTIPPDSHHTLIADELAFLNKQEAAGEISLHSPY
jgi:hypothetical protein